MKISDLLAQATNHLEKSGVTSSKLDSLILLTHALSVSKEEVIFNPNREIAAEKEQEFFALIARRANREPVSQIIERREFFGHDFFVNSNVLDPRPDSESVIELVLEKFPQKDFAQKRFEIAEIGLGSGCLIITLLKLYEKAHATGVDISPKALEICQRNASQHKVLDRINISESDLFSTIPKNQKFDLIISNPPYIPSQDIESLETEVRIFEPRNALDGGLDGLDFYRRIAAESPIFLNQNSRVIVEIGFGQKEEVVKIFIEQNFLFEESKKDLAGIDRALSFIKK